ncbi:5'-nucleotidase C-terminal domain-containing protein [Pseudomonas aeruginosa]|uniref:5'-nucleotidase C-terminal domain-containing protein n=1 Tax=Pseudomonas aeruginosa TaxID=287 RepID=UPI002877CC8C|nr:5'-nucleotidase C-terminal domain-containing protein [Pseudomonas aeruginosa]
MLKVQPFANELVYVDFKGEEIEPYLSAVACMKPDSGAYAQFYNVSLTVDPECHVSDVKIAGKPLDKTKNYRMATLNFNAIGGDGYPKIDSHPGYVNTGFVDAEVLKGYIEAHSPLKADVYEPKKQKWQIHKLHKKSLAI